MGNLIQQITSAYEAERPHVSEKIYSAAEIPLSYESITPEWLTAVICRKSPGAQVVSHRLGPTDEGSSNRRKIHLEYNDAGRRAELPQVLFCKATHGLANRIILGVSDGANCEAIFYNYIRPELDIEAPVGYFAAVDQESFNSIIMLNDISKSVTEFCSHRTRMTRERAESQMRLLATVHGTYHGRAESSAALTGIPSWTDYFNRTFEFGMEDGSNQGFLDGKDVIPPRLYARYPEIWPKTLASVRLHDAHPKTYAHGDVHLKNWYVAGNGEMGLADWQCSHRGHWARDVCYDFHRAHHSRPPRLGEGPVALLPRSAARRGRSQDSVRRGIYCLSATAPYRAHVVDDYFAPGARDAGYAAARHYAGVCGTHSNGNGRSRFARCLRIANALELQTAVDCETLSRDEVGFARAEE
jgi:hypothetical protein